MQRSRINKTWLDIIQEKIISEKEKKHKQRWEMVLDILTYNRLKTVNDEIWRFNKIIWVKDGEEIVDDKIVEKIAKVTKNEINEIKTLIKIITRGEFHTRGNMIAFNNGILDVGTMEFYDSASETELETEKILADMDMTRALSLRYWREDDPELFKLREKCPAIEKFLSEVLQPDDIPMFYELLGWCLLNNYTFQKAFIFVGTGANGKSRLLELMKIFLGVENISSMTLEQLTMDKFAIANLYGKYANIAADIPKVGLTKTGLFKSLTGGDLVNAQRKYGHAFDFMNTAKLIFSCNEIPANYFDDTDAFWRRWIEVDCLNTFIGEKCNPYILDKISTEDELSGLVYPVLEGIKRLYKNGRFSNDKPITETKKRYIMKSDPVGAFKEEMIVEEPNTIISKRELYNEFVDFCKENQLSVCDDGQFARKLRKYFGKGLMDIQTKYKGSQKQMYCWQGIRLKDVQDVEIFDNLQTRLDQ